MKKYIKPEIEFALFKTEDIITTSSASSTIDIIPDIDGGIVTFLEDWIKSWTESEK